MGVTGAVAVVMVGALTVRWMMTGLPTEPALSVAKTSIVFAPSVVKVTGMSKLPKASVELLPLAVSTSPLTSCVGLNPPMIVGFDGSVMSSTVIQVAFPKPETSVALTP